MYSTRLSLLRIAAIAAVLVGGAAPSSAMADDKPAAPPARDGGKARGRDAANPPKAPGEGLRGGERTGDGAAKTRGESRGRGESRSSARALVPIIKSLDLTEEQQTKVDEILAEFEKAQTEFEATGQPKLREIQKQRESERKANGKVSPETERAMKEVLAQRPKAEVMVSKLVQVLTPEQKKAFHDKREAFGRDQRDGDRKPGRDARGRDRGPAGAAGRGGADAPKRGMPPRRDGSSKGGDGSDAPSKPQR